MSGLHFVASQQPWRGEARQCDTMRSRRTGHHSLTMASGGEVPTAASTTNQQQQQLANRTGISYGGGFWRSLIITAPSSTFTTVVVVIVVMLCRGVQWGAAGTLDATEDAILKDFVNSYNLGQVVNVDTGPCYWGPKYISCSCWYENATVCHVTQLDFSKTSMQGTFPTNLTKLSELYALSLYNNNMTGPLPPEIGNLWKLTSLSIGDNKFSGRIPSELKNLTSLGLLHLDSNQFNGTIPIEISHMKSLQNLWLNDNNLSGQPPDIFSNLTNLLEVRIYGNPLLTGPIPMSLFNISSLQAVYFGELSPGGAIPTSFTTPLVNLTVLYLRNCQLTGSIPGKTINMFSNLSYLDLSFNNLSGSIPSELANIKTLKALYLGNNNLNGSLPEGLGALSSLSDVDVSYNQLSGNLPSWAGNSINPPILVSNNFNTTSAANYSQLIQTQLSLLSCKNQTAPCLQSNSRKFTTVAVHAGGEKYSNYNSDTTPLNTTAIFLSTDMSWAVTRTGYMNGSSISGIQSTNKSRAPYDTARTSLGSLRYYGLNLENGNYTVDLSFAEIVYPDITQDATSRRVFDIYLQGQLVLKDFNIQELAGNSFIGIDKTFVAQVSNGVLDIHLFYAGKGTCCTSDGRWSFGPLISAISATNVLNRSSSSTNIPLIVGSVIAAVIFSLAICFLSTLIVLRRRRNKTTLQQEDQLEMARFRVQPNLFSYAELKAATRSFHPDNKLGEGGYGAVFKGVLPDQTEVAVKTLSQQSCQGKQEFLNEAALITAVQHRNLVKLKGCCLERDHRILVYEFMENKSLNKTLFGSCDMKIHLNWSTRFSIALGIARGLAYLHEESEVRIIHRDIKSSNILLDKNFNPKIADFGLARLIQDFESHVSTRVAGTLGYVAPEYVLLGQLTEKADVFSFGVVLLELISGRFNTRPDLPEHQTYLLEWAWNLKGDDDLLSLLDPNLNEYDEHELWRMTHVAFLCTQAAANTRPSMTRVVAMLLGDIEIPATVSSPGFMSGLMGTPPSKATTELIRSTSRAGILSSSTTNSRMGRGSEDESPFLTSTTTSQWDTTEEIIRNF